MIRYDDLFLRPLNADESQLSLSHRSRESYSTNIEKEEKKRNKQKAGYAQKKRWVNSKS